MALVEPSGGVKIQVRQTGIELWSLAWEAHILPLGHRATNIISKKNVYRQEGFVINFALKQGFCAYKTVLIKIKV